MGRATKWLVLGAVALAVGGAWATMAAAQNVKTPPNWSYEIRDGKRVPKGNRVTNADGSWREEVRQGNCVTIKEMSAAGEYKETRQCNPK
jgi:hypothetical protein